MYPTTHTNDRQLQDIHPISHKRIYVAYNRQYTCCVKEAQKDIPLNIKGFSATKNGQHTPHTRQQNTLIGYSILQPFEVHVVFHNQPLGYALSRVCPFLSTSFPCPISDDGQIHFPTYINVSNHLLENQHDSNLHG